MANQIAIHGSTLWVASQEIVYHSVDSGATWVQASTGLPPPTNGTRSISCLASVAGRLYAGSRYYYMGAPLGELYMSVDGGASWNVTTLGEHVQCVDGNGPSLLAGGWGGVHRSTDLGASWSKVGASQVYYVASLAASGSVIVAGRFGGGIDRSTNDGTSWVSGAEGISGSVDFLVFSDSTLYAGTNPDSRLAGVSAVYVSTDLGASWRMISAALPQPPISALAVQGTTIYVGTTPGVYRSTDSGSSWTLSTAGLPASSVNGLAVVGDLLVATTGAGVYRSTDGGVTWVGANGGLSTTEVPSLVWHANQFFAGTATLGVHRSSDVGKTWISSNDGISTSAIASFTTSGRDLFAAARGTGVYRSTNSGSTWVRVDNGLPLGLAIIAFGTDLYAGGYLSPMTTRMYRSTDRGNDWSIVDPPSPVTVELVNSFCSNEGTLYAGTAGGILKVSSAGTKWEWVGGYSGFSSWRSPMHTFTMNGAKVYGGWTGAIKFSGDRGRTWTDLPGSSPSNVYAFTRVNGVLFAGGQGQIALSKDDGWTWSDVSLGLPSNVQVLSLAANDTVFLAGTRNHGVWSRRVSEMVDNSGGPSGGATEYFLAQNFPNPFNPKTLIQYRLPVSGIVRLTVYDLLGREVTVLVNDFLPAGTHEATFDGSGLASGVYLCRMRAGEYTQARKMIIVR